MHTLRKLPRHSPRSPAPNSRIGSAATQHLVQEDPCRDGDVERLGAVRQRNRPALRGDRVELRADARPFITHDHRDRALVHPPPFAFPGSPERQGTVQGNSVHRGRPQGDAVLARPGDEAEVVERYDRVAEGRSHRGPQCLGAQRVGRAAQHDRARGAQRVRRSDQRAHIPRVLHRVDHQGCPASPTTGPPPPRARPPPPPRLPTMSASVPARGSTTAMIPWGVSVSASDANTRAVACSPGTACRPSSATSAVPRAVRSRSGATTAPRNRRPAARASSTNRTPSISARPRRPRALRRWRYRTVDCRLLAMPTLRRTALAGRAVTVQEELQLGNPAGPT